MKQIVRYKCDFCNKIAAKPQTIMKHELECTKNPNGRNCFVCKHSCQGGWDGDNYRPNEAYCTIQEVSLTSLRQENFTAMNCEDFVRTEEMYYERLHEDNWGWDYDPF